MRFTILGALLGTAALAGAGGIAITQSSAQTPLPVTESPAAVGAALPATAPGKGAYVVRTEIAERDGFAYLDVTVTYENAARFSVKQRVCKRKRCRTVRVGLTVTEGSGQVSRRLGRGDHWLRGKPSTKMWLLPGPTVTVTAPPVTVTETVTATVTLTCRPEPPTPTLTSDPTVPPTITGDPTVTPTITEPSTEAPSEPPTE